MLDIAKAKNNLDWHPKWDTKESIYKTIDWYQNFMLIMTLINL